MPDNFLRTKSNRKQDIREPACIYAVIRSFIAIDRVTGEKMSPIALSTLLLGPTGKNLPCSPFRMSRNIT